MGGGCLWFTFKSTRAKQKKLRPKKQNDGEVSPPFWSWISTEPGLLSTAFWLGGSLSSSVAFCKLLLKVLNF